MLARLWEWLVATGDWINGVWILAALIIGVILFLFLRREAEYIVRKLVPEQVYALLNENRKILRWTIIITGGILIAFVVSIIIIANIGVDVTPVLSAAGNWLLAHGVRILIIIGIGYILHVIAKAMIPWLVRRSIVAGARERETNGELNKRVQTLSRLFIQTAAILIIITAFFMILSEVEIDIAPLLASAGIAGIAIGFGAQNLIKDVINGVFILAENQYNVGDVVRIASIAGLVENITLRRTVLRDLDGIVHNIPNGEITTSSNFTKEMSRVNLNIPVAYGADIDRCIEVINRVGAELAQDKTFGPMMLSAPKFLRVDNFSQSGIELKILGDTKPLMQWEVAGELRKRIKKAFDSEGIEIPWPHVKLYFGDDTLQKLFSRNADTTRTGP